MLNYSSDTHIVSVVSTDETAIKRASMLADRHIKNLRQKMLLRHRAEETAKKLEVCHIFGCSGDLV